MEIEEMGNSIPQMLILSICFVQKKRRDLIIELKSRRTSDRVVEHISRCLGWIIEETAGDKNVEGLIVNT